jgi:hypothetical protein
MDQAKFCYGKRADGTSVAYWEIGDGPARPLVSVPTMPSSHIEREDAVRLYEVRLQEGGA